MSVRDHRTAVLFFGIFLVISVDESALGAQRPPGAEEFVADRARELHERVLTLDAHVDIPFDFATPAVDPGVRGGRQVDIPKMLEGKLDVEFFNVYVAQVERTPASYEKARLDALTKFEALHRMVEDMYPEKIGLALTADDVMRIHRAGKLVAAIGIENGFVIGRDLGLIDEYYEHGARYMGLAHGGHNDLADSSTPLSRLGDAETEHDGLSALGGKTVARMNRLGMMVDISHLSKAATLDALRVTTAPVIASHSGAKAVADVARNLDDEELRAIAENGGVVHVIALAAFVKLDPPDKREAIRKLADDVGARYISGSVGPAALAELAPKNRAVYDRRRAVIDSKWPRPNVHDFVDHIDYIVGLVGVDHVGIGSDFDGGGGIDGWDDASESFNVTLELVRRGYTEEDVAKIWSGNFLRVWRQVERVAAELEARAGANSHSKTSSQTVWRDRRR